MAYRTLTFSVPTSGAGATPAATFSFFTIGYRPPRQHRISGQDVVSNQNGIFKYRYDNGPGPYEWNTFEIRISDTFRNELGSATQQQANLDFLWQYKSGPMGMADPERVYSVVWAPVPLEPVFEGFPVAAGDKIHKRYSISLEEG